MVVVFSVFMIMFGILILLTFLKYKKEKKEKKQYINLIYDILNTDFKTRKVIEKNCNDYLEHKVINNFASQEFLNNCKLILDRIKYLNLINAIEPIENKENEKTAETTNMVEAEKKASGKSKKKEIEK